MSKLRIHSFVQGMVALHNSPITAHGNLKSSKCLIDGRWVCKISDHGLDSVKANQTEEDLGEYAEYRSKSSIIISNVTNSFLHEGL